MRFEYNLFLFSIFFCHWPTSPASCRPRGVAVHHHSSSFFVSTGEFSFLRPDSDDWSIRKGSGLEYLFLVNTLHSVVHNESQIHMLPLLRCWVFGTELTGIFLFVHDWFYWILFIKEKKSYIHEELALCIFFSCCSATELSCRAKICTHILMNYSKVCMLQW